MLRTLRAYEMDQVSLLLAVLATKWLKGWRCELAQFTVKLKVKCTEVSESSSTVESDHSLFIGIDFPWDGALLTIIMPIRHFRY